MSRAFSMRKVAAAGSVVLLTGILLAMSAAGHSLWSLHFLSYFPVSIQILLFAVTAAAFGIGFSRVRWRGLLPDLPPSVRLSPVQTDVIVALTCGIIFLLFSSKTALLGDGQLWLNELDAGTSNYFLNRAPFTLFLLHTLYSWLNPLTGISPRHLFGLGSVIAGVTAVLGWLRLARYLRIRRGAALLFGFAWGGVALFFGYVETYVLMSAILTWMLVLMIISLREGEFSLFVPILALLAVGFCLAAVVFLPAAMAYTWRLLVRKPLNAWWVLSVFGALLVLAVTIYFALGWYKGTDVFLPLRPTRNAFGDSVLSTKHFVDLLNVFVLAAGAFIVLLLSYIAVEMKGGWRWDDEKLLLLLTLAFPVIACVMHNPQLGMARDWDICGALLVSAPVLSLVFWDSIRSYVDASSHTYALLTGWILLVIIPWVGVQASEARSLARFRDLLRFDPTKSESGWDYLSSYYYHQGRMDDWAQCILEAMRYSDNPRYHASMSLYFATRRDWPNARYQAGLAHAAVMKDSVITERETTVTDPAGLISVGNTYLERAYVRDGREAFDAAALLQPESPLPVIATLDLDVKLRAFAEAEAAVIRLAAKGQNAVETARKYFAEDTLLQSSDQRATGWLAFGLLAAQQGDSSAAANDAAKVRSLSQDDATQQFVSRLIQHLSPANPQ